MATTCLSGVERHFIRKQSSLRADGRSRVEGRKIEIIKTTNSVSGQTQCQVALGNTKALAAVSASPVVPFEDRPNEGVVKINVVLSAMAREEWDPSLKKQKAAQALHISSVIEHAVLETRAVDLEGLCIIAGRKVWAIKLDITILNDAGNVIDAGTLAAFAALSEFRRPDVAVVGDSVQIFGLEDREPVPLSIHHMPLCITFSLFNSAEDSETVPSKPPKKNDKSGDIDENDVDDDEHYFLMDPTDREELAHDGQITIIVNAHKEICGIHKHGWPPLASDQVSRLVSIATDRAPELAEELVK